MTYYYDHLKGTFVSDTDATDLGKDVPVRKPNAVPPKTKTIKKFNQGGSAASKPLVPDLEKMIDLYDDPQGEDFKLKYNANSGVYVNKLGTISTRNAVDANKINELFNPKKKVQAWDIMKASAKEKAKKGDYSELRELRKIERKAKKQTFPKKISNTDQRTLTKAPDPIPTIPLNFLKIDQDKDPIMIAKEKRFLEILKDNERKKNKLEGLAYLMGVKE